LYAFLISPVHATCPTHLILLDLITLIILGVVYELQSSFYAVFSIVPPLPPS